MTIEARHIRSPSEWHEWRAVDVTASEVAAIFGLHPYKSPLELWGEKSGLVETSRRDSAVMLRGRILEPAVAAAVAIERPEWRLVKCEDYFSDTRNRIGASPDYWIEGDPRGLGVLQCKTASPKVFETEFAEESPPFWITLQNATELMLTSASGAKFGVVAVLQVDAWKAPRVKIYDIPRHKPAERRVRDGVASFWQAVRKGVQPKVDPTQDAALIAALYPEEVDGLEIDLNGDNDARGLLQEREELLRRRGEDNDRLDEIATTIKAKLRGAATGFVGPYVVNWKTQKRAQVFIPESRGRVLRVSKRKV